MKKRCLLLFLSLVCVSYAEDDVNYKSESKSNVSSIEAYRIGYTDGYEKGKKDGFIEGYKKAIEDFRRIYAEKLQEYQEIEAGKILIKEWRVSYPRVYQIPTKGGSQVVIEGCQVIKPFEDLLQYIPVREVFSAGKEEDLEVKTLGMYVKVKVKGGYEKTLRETDAIFFKEEGSEDFTAYFKDEQSMREFCREYKGACYEKSR